MNKGGTGAFLQPDKNNYYHFIKKIDNTENFKENKLYSQYTWMKHMHKEYNEFFPIIFRPYPNGYVMENLSKYKTADEIFVSKEYEAYKSNLFSKILDILFVIKEDEKYTEMAQMYDFSTYIKRVEEHINFMIKSHLNLFSKYDKVIINNYEHYPITIKTLNNIVEELNKNKDYFNFETSNCHGDCTLENILVKTEDIKFIDSNYILNGWNSWLLDISKLLQSTHYDYEHLFFTKDDFIIFEDNEILNVNYSDRKSYKNNIFFRLKNLENIDYKKVLLLEITHYIRMLKYKAAISEIDLIKAYTILTKLCKEYFGGKND